MSTVDGDFVDGAEGNLPFLPDDDDDDQDGPPPERSNKPSRRKKAKAVEAGAVDAGGKQMSLEELDAADSLDRDREMPKPVENVKTLGELYAKYQIGANPEFQAVLSRSSPKFWKNVKVDGRYGVYDSPITEDYIQSTYGGGVFRVSIEGPHPTKGIGFKKHYESVPINLPGDPLISNLPRPEESTAAVAQVAGVQQPQQESPKVVETVLNQMGKILGDERQDRRDAERRADAGATSMQPMMDAVAAAHAQRADAAEVAATARVQSEKDSYERLLQNERDERKRIEAKLDEVTKEIASMNHEQQNQPRVSMGEELSKILSVMPQPQPKDDSTARFAEATVTQMQARHGEETARIHEQHGKTLDAMRGAHAAEKVVLHESQQREIQSEREAGRRREERVEDSLKSEREERRRDHEAHRKELESLDLRWKERLENTERAAKERMDGAERAWKERIDQQKQMLDTSFESRYQSAQAGWENRLQFLQTELDRAKQDVADLRARGFEQTDPLAVIQKHKQLAEAFGVPDGGAAAPSSGGIGLSGDSGDMWKTQLVDGLVDRLPMVLGAVENIFTKAQQPQQAPSQPVHGQIIVENGVEYVVLSTPKGWQKVPKQQLDEHQRALAARAEAERRQLPAGTTGASGRRYVPRQGKEPKPSRIPVPDLSHGLVKPGSQDGTSGDEDARVEELTRIASERSTGATVATAPPPAPAPAERPRRSQPVPQQQAPAAQQEPSDGGALRMSAQEKSALLWLAKQVHDAVAGGDEPEEFVAKLTQSVPSNALKAIVTNYTPEQIEKGIMALEPRSAGATPAGQAFVRRAFGLLRDQIEG